MKPFEKSTEEMARRVRVQRRMWTFGAHIGEAKARIHRSTLELQATARSSAAVAGAENDLSRLRRWVHARIFGEKAVSQAETPPRYLDAAATSVASEIEHGAARIAASARRAKLRALDRSRTVSGLAIDSHRLARRLRGLRRVRRGRAGA